MEAVRKSLNDVVTSPKASTPPPSPMKKQNLRAASPRSPGAPAILVTIDECREKRDAANTFYLYPGTNLFYVFDVKTRAGRWEILRRFSEVKKFWEKMTLNCLLAVPS